MKIKFKKATLGAHAFYIVFYLVAKRVGYRQIIPAEGVTILPPLWIQYIIQRILL